MLFLTQNFFSQGKGRRDCSLNTHYIVLFKNPRDKQQIHCLSRQVFPENPRFITEAFADATSTPYGYLLLDLTQTIPEQLRVRTNIFPGDNQNTTVYVPRHTKSLK